MIINNNRRVPMIIDENREQDNYCNDINNDNHNNDDNDGDLIIIIS